MKFGKARWWVMLKIHQRAFSELMKFHCLRSISGILAVNTCIQPCELEGTSLFTNKWGFNIDFNRQGKTLNTSLLRGGPGVYQHGYTEQEYEISSDESRKVFLAIEYENSFSDDRISHHNEIALDLNWKATTSMVLSSELTFNKSIDDLQFIEDDNIAAYRKLCNG